MTRRAVPTFTLALGLAWTAAAQTATPTKVAIINIPAALANTSEGQKAQSEMQTKFGPREKELEKRRQEIEGLRDQLNRTSNTASEDARQKLMRDIDTKTKAFNRDMEDARAELQTEEQRFAGEIYTRMAPIIEEYARNNGYALVLNVGTPGAEGLVAWFSSSVEITRDIVDLFNKRNAGGAAAPAGGTTTPPPTTGAKPAVPPPARPATPTPAKPAAPKPGATK